MAQRRIAEPTLPPSHLELATSIISRLPAAQQSSMRQIISLLSERYGDRVGDSLIYLDRITLSENFRPSHIGTLRLIVDRGGENVESALSEFDRLIQLDKFNPHVHAAARLAVIRSGENCHEAIRALYFLISNPSFTERSLTIALPSRFINYLNTAIRNGGDTQYLAIRAMGSMFANSCFTPSELDAAGARSFGTVLRMVRESSDINHIHAMDALCSLLGNGHIRPQDFTSAHAQTLGRLVSIVVEYTRALDVSSNDETLRRLNLVLGHRIFNLDMLLENGLLSRAVNGSTSNMLEILNSFHMVMSRARRQPEVLSVVADLISRDVDPVVAFYLVSAVSSNSSLAPLLQTSDFAERLATIVTLLYDSTELSISSDSSAVSRFIPTSGSIPEEFNEMPSLGSFYSMLRSDQFTPSIFTRFEEIASSLEEDAELGVHLIAACFSRPGFRAIDANSKLFSAILSLTRRVSGIATFDYQVLYNLLSSRNFRSSMIETGGLIPSLLSVQSEDNVELSLGNIRAIIENLGNGRQTISLIRQAIRFGGRDASAFLTILARISSNSQFRRSDISSMLEFIRITGPLSPLSIGLFEDMLNSLVFCDQAHSAEFVRRLARLVVRSKGSSISEAGIAIDSIAGILRISPMRLLVDHFNPDRTQSLSVELMDQLYFASQISGPLAFRIFDCLRAVSSNGETDLITIFEPRYIQFLVAVELVFQAHGGALEQQLHDSFAAHLLSEGNQFDILAGQSSAAISFIEGVVSGAGRSAPEAIQAVIPMLTRGISIGGPEPEELGLFIQRYLSTVPSGQRDVAMAGLQEMFTSIPLELLNFLIDEPELFARGRHLARRLMGGGLNDPTIFLNFAYAIDEIGEEMASALYRSYGVRYFARYSDDMLEHMYENIEGSTRPTIFVTYPHHDGNGAFYREGRVLDQLREHYNVVVYEVGDEGAFYTAVRDFGRRYGTTSTIIIAGHGNPGSIRLGSDEETGMLDLSDEQEFRLLRSILRRSGTVILDSCSTGANEAAIGAMVSRVLGARLFAPRVPSRLISFGSDQLGTTAKYHIDTTEFRAGLLIQRRTTSDQ